MNRKKAVDYLKRKGKDVTDEDTIKQVMKEGKIFGDPVVDLKY